MKRRTRMNQISGGKRPLAPISEDEGQKETDMEQLVRLHSLTEPLICPSGAMCCTGKRNDNNRTIGWECSNFDWVHIHGFPVQDCCWLFTFSNGIKKLWIIQQKCCNYLTFFFSFPISFVAERLLWFISVLLQKTPLMKQQKYDPICILVWLPERHVANSLECGHWRLDNDTKGIL